MRATLPSSRDDAIIRKEMAMIKLGRVSKKTKGPRVEGFVEDAMLTPGSIFPIG